MAKVLDRTYDSSDLKELMGNVGGWAENWNDVIRYLKGPAIDDADFARDEIPQLIEDFESLKDNNISFTTDYRRIYEMITGEKHADLPPPEGIRESPTNPLELEDEFLAGLSIPAFKSDVLKQARKNNAPARVLNVLQKIEDKEYLSMGVLLEAIGDHAWDHD
jgi:hypothetical protein